MHSWETLLNPKAKSTETKKSEGLRPFCHLSNYIIRSNVEWEWWTIYSIVLLVTRGGGEGGNIVLHVSTHTDSTHTYVDTSVRYFSDTSRPFSLSNILALVPSLLFCPVYSFPIFFFLAFLYSPLTHSMTPRSALFLLWVSFILPQSLLSCLLSIPESGRNQVNEENSHLATWRGN